MLLAGSRAAPLPLVGPPTPSPTRSLPPSPTGLTAGSHAPFAVGVGVAARGGHVSHEWSSWLSSDAGRGVGARRGDRWSCCDAQRATPLGAGWGGRAVPGAGVGVGVQHGGDEGVDLCGVDLDGVAVSGGAQGGGAGGDGEEGDFAGVEWAKVWAAASRSKVSSTVRDVRAASSSWCSAAGRGGVGWASRHRGPGAPTRRGSFVGAGFGRDHRRVGRVVGGGTRARRRRRRFGVRRVDRRRSSCRAPRR